MRAQSRAASLLEGPGPDGERSRPHLINVVEAVAADDDVICHLNHGVALN